MPEKNDIIRLLEGQVDSIRRFGVREIGVFGSYARGDQGPNSDVDVLVDMQPERETFRDYMGLLHYLEELFGRKVDLVMKDTVKPIIKERVFGETVYVSGL